MQTNTVPDNVTTSSTEPPVDPIASPIADPVAQKVDASPASSKPSAPKVQRQTRRTAGSGAMGLRMADEAPTPQREELQRAAARAQTTGHRFDLMRYLRLRRKG